jgi:hypothetical protein
MLFSFLYNHAFNFKAHTMFIVFGYRCHLPRDCY